MESHRAPVPCAEGDPSWPRLLRATRARAGASVRSANLRAHIAEVVEDVRWVRPIVLADAFDVVSGGLGVWILPQNLAFASGDGDVFRVAAAARRRLPYVVLCKVWEATSCSMRARKFNAGCGHTPSIDCAESLRQSEQNLASDLLNFSFIIIIH